VSSYTGRPTGSGRPMPNPSVARTREQFAGCLNDLMLWAGRSHRGVAKKSAATRYSISWTTAANLTAGTTEPQFRSVLGFLYGCGLPQDQLEPWKTKYEELYPRQPAARQRSGERAASAARARPLAAVDSQASRSLYGEQVRRLSPNLLEDRHAELAAMVEFCAENDRGSYWWWRGAPWTGKTALMSWFVLHPPPKTRVVAFFITGRYAGHNNSSAFTTFAVEQLADILRQPVPTQPTPQHGELLLVAMLREAADVCKHRGDRLLLVVDGLDEDQGVPSMGDAHSIAALLPAMPPDNIRIIVSSRHNPGIARDVPSDHPLLDPSVVHDLIPSPRANVVRQDAERELDRLLEGAPVEHVLIGLLIAAGGGLSCADIAEVSGRQEREVSKALNAVSGRTFIRQMSTWRPEHPSEVYLLGHEELEATARRFLGATRLAGYRDQIHAWAEKYRKEGWPSTTPDYLFVAYFGMLREQQDGVRIVACALDPVRHRRMLDIADGMEAALAEISLAQDEVLHRPGGALATVARLAMHRHALLENSINIPIDLPMTWAMLGLLWRGVNLARSITEPLDKPIAVSTLALVAAGTGNPGAASSLIDEIEDPAARSELLDSLLDPWLSLVMTARRTVLADAAPQIALAIPSPLDRASCLDALAAWHRAALGGRATGDSLPEYLVQHLQTAEVLGTVAAALRDNSPRDTELQNGVDVAAAMTDRKMKISALCMLSHAAQVSGNADLARSLAEEAAGSLPSEGWIFGYEDVAAAFAAIGDIDRATTLAAFSSLITQAKALTAVARVLAREGDQVQGQRIASIAEENIRKIINPAWQIDILDVLSRMAVRVGHNDHLPIMSHLARLLVRFEIGARYGEGSVLRAVGIVAAAGDLADAEDLADHLPPMMRTVAFAILAQAAARIGKKERARAYFARARADTPSYRHVTERLQTLAAQAHAAVLIGDNAQAVDLLADCQATIEDSSLAQELIWQPEAPSALDDVLLVARMIGDQDLEQAILRTARRLVDGIEDSRVRARLVSVAVRTAAPVEARRLVCEAFRTEMWTAALPALTYLEPEAVPIIVDEFVSQLVERVRR
jgi:hypothetical protein